MAEIVSLQRRRRIAPERWVQQRVYGEVRGIEVVLTIREADGTLHVALFGGLLIGIESLAEVSADAAGLVAADAIGRAALRAIELSELEFTCSGDAA